MTDVLREVPEFFEGEHGEAIQMRVDAIGQYRELGPPDLVHITKVNVVKGDVPKLGSFHHTFGVDASSMASLAAYINTLLYAQGETQGWFGKGREWRISTGVYCCYNAFSRVDMRVEVNIPGGTESYVLDARGDRHEATADLWTETYLSAMIRAILYSDDHKYPLRGFRRRDPIPDLAAEKRFLDAIEAQFWKAPQLGTDPEIQIATNARNHLTRALMRYFSESGRWELAAGMFEKLVQADPEIAGLLACAYFGMDEEVRGVRVLHDAVKRAPTCYGLLLDQVDFLVKKGRLDSARDLARYAVDAAPSEFVTWAALANVHTELQDPRNALLTLNSCPMFTFNDRDRPRMPMPVRAHFMVKPDPITGERIDELDPDTDGGSLPRLAGAHLRGTFAAAYSKLARLASTFGWDELLKYRSQVFVMEEEYRQVKAQEEEVRRGVTPRPPEAKTVAKDIPKPASPEPRMDLKNIPEHDPNAAQSDSEDAEIASAVEDRLSEDKAEVNNEKEAVPLNEGSSEKVVVDVLNINGAAVKDTNDDPESDGEDVWGPQTLPDEKPTVIIAKPGALDKPIPVNKAVGDSFARPSTAPVREDDESSRTNTPKKSDPNAKPLYTAFSNKRLCERWLDNLFMVLYEDLRAYTIWRAEVAHHKKHNTAYTRPLADVEQLGDLAVRLCKKAEAQEAYEHVVANKYSVHSWTKLLEMYTEAGDMQRVLEAAVYLAKYHDCHFNEGVYPHVITRYLMTLVREHGLSKVTNTLISIPYVSEASQKLVQRYLGYAKKFGVEGAGS